MVKVLLVIECSPGVNWYEIFADSKLHGVEAISVEQATWGEVGSVVSFPDTGCQVELRPSAHAHGGTSQERNRTVRPDFILMRSVTRSVGHLDDRNKLYTLKHANIPTVNSLHSCYLACERVWAFSELKRVQQRLRLEGVDFPLIPQTLYANAGNMLIDPGFPCVVKIGPYHSGFGKIKVDTPQTFQDVKGIVAMHADYATAERFIDYDYDIRIQKIGPHYRAFRRRSPIWKANTGNASTNEDAEVTPQYRLWVDECARVFGGLDILALDAVHDRATGKDIILELNDTAIGLAHRYEKEDYQHMRALVLTRMAEHYPLSAPAAASAGAGAGAGTAAPGDAKGAAPVAAADVKIAVAAAPASGGAAGVASAAAAAAAGAAVDGVVASDLGSESGRLRFEVQQHLQRVAELTAANEQLQKQLADARAAAQQNGGCCTLM